MKCQILFSVKNKKNISTCHQLKILPRVVSINLHDAQYKNRAFMLYVGNEVSDQLVPLHSLLTYSISCLFVLRFYSRVNPMGPCRARSVYITICLLGRLSPLSS